MRWLLIALLLLAPLGVAQPENCEPPSCIVREAQPFIHSAVWEAPPVVGEQRDVLINGYRSAEDAEMEVELLVPNWVQVIGKSTLPVPQEEEFQVTFRILVLEEGFFALRARLIMQEDGTEYKGPRTLLGHHFGHANATLASWDAFRMMRHGDLMYNVTAGREADGKIWVDALVWAEQDWRRHTDLEIQVSGRYLQGEAESFAGSWYGPREGGHAPAGIHFNASIAPGQTLELAIRLNAAAEFDGAPGDQWQGVQIGCFGVLNVQAQGPDVTITPGPLCNPRADDGSIPGRDEWQRDTLLGMEEEPVRPPGEESPGLGILVLAAIAVALARKR